MKVEAVMSKKLVSATPTDTVMRVARAMKSQDIGAVPVVRDMQSMYLEGIVTDRDLCNAVIAEGKDTQSTLVEEAMTRKPVTCKPTDTLETCEKLMAKHQIRRIPVVDDADRCVGMVAQSDIVRHAKAEDVTKTLRAISRPKHGRPHVGAVA